MKRPVRMIMAFDDAGELFDFLHEYSAITGKTAMIQRVVGDEPEMQIPALRTFIVNGESTKRKKKESK